MENCLMNYFVVNAELRNSCEFNPDFFEAAPAVYEVVRVQDGIPLFLEDHLKRFFNSAKIFGLNISVTKSQIKSRVKATIESNGLKQGLIKFIFLIHPEAGELFAAWVTPFFFPSAETYQKGIDVISLQGSRNSPNAKVSRQVVRQQADQLIKKQHIYEVMLVNNDGTITECSRSNIFFVKGGLLFTAYHKLVLEGITRGKIIDLAIKSGIDVLESRFYLPELSNFEAAFITGSTPKVLAIKKIDNHVFPVNNPVLQHLSKQYENLITDYQNKFRW